MTDEQNKLFDVLKKANVDADMIKNGITLTQVGMQKVSTIMGIDIEQVIPAIQDLAKALKRGPIFEDRNRYTYESDTLGNVTIRDSKSGNEKYLRGDEAFALLREISFSNDAQGLIAPYFAITESAEENDFMDEMRSKSGTFNFGYGSGTGTASYKVGPKGEFIVKIIMLRDRSGREITKYDENEVMNAAIAYIDHV